MMAFHKLLLLLVFFCSSLRVVYSWEVFTSNKNDSGICSACLNEDGVFQDNCLTPIRCECSAKTLDCSSLSLKNLPVSLSFPTGINVAIFKDNKIGNIKDDAFYNGMDIVELDLSSNLIDFVSLSAFLAFPNLRRLSLNHNQLWNFPSAVFDGLNKLRVLDLSYNQIKTLLPDIFSHMTDLRELKLEANPLQEIEPKQFEHLSKLETLDLESTLVQNFSDYTFSFTPKLKFLGLANNQLHEVPHKALRGLKNLKLLDLSGNPITVIRGRAFSGLQKLVQLHLNRMPSLKRIEKYAFGYLKSMRELHCSYNYILSFIDKDAFIAEAGDEKIALDLFTLRQNNLETLPLGLLRWEQYTELQLDGNAWNCDCRLKWMTQLKLKNFFQTHLRCANPSEFRGRLFNTLKETDFVCEITNGGTIFLICLCVVAIVILTSIVGCFVYRKNSVKYDKPNFRVFKQTDVDEVVYERSFKP